MRDVRTALVARSGVRRPASGARLRLRDVSLEWEQTNVDARDPVWLGRWWPEALGSVVVNDAPDEFEIRPAPDRLPDLLFVPVPESKTSKNRLHLDFRPDDQFSKSIVGWCWARPGSTWDRGTRRGLFWPIPKETNSASWASGPSGEGRTTPLSVRPCRGRSRPFALGWPIGGHSWWLVPDSTRSRLRTYCLNRCSG